MDTPGSRLRFLTINVLLWLSFVSACLFYGTGENLLLLFISTGFLLAAGALIPLECWHGLYRQQRFAVWLCGYTLAILIIGYQFITVSPDNSFAISWVLAALPIWYLVCAANPQRRWLLVALIAMIGLFALHSALAFLLLGQAAYEPFGDPNHYASVLYLVWIPLAHRLLLYSGQNRLPRTSAAASHLFLFTLALVIAATNSRVGMTMIAAALLGWLLLTLIRRLPPMPWLLIFANTASAFLICWLLTPEGVSGSADVADLLTGVSIRAALNTAALQMALEAPLTGSGIFTFPLIYPLFRLPGDQSTAGMFVHNDYLQLLLESGPWLVLALLVVMIAIARRLWNGLFSSESSAVAGFGLAMAAAALMAHACVNYVFYFMPLVILFAVVCAELFSRPAEQTDKVSDDPQQPSSVYRISSVAHSAAVRAFWLMVLLGGFSSWGYLGLDVVTQGVFGGQAAPGFIGGLQRDVPTMLSYSRTARALNDERVTPVLAEALLFTALLENDSGSGVSKQAIVERYRLALAMDPYNSAAYQQYHDFIVRFADAELLANLTPQETPEALLLKVVQLELGRTPSVFTLLSIYDQQGQQEKALRMLKLSVYPWLERIQWAQPKNTEVMLAEMVRRAEAADDQTFLAQLRARAREIEHIRPSFREERLKVWQRELLR